MTYTLYALCGEYTPLYLRSQLLLKDMAVAYRTKQELIYQELHDGILKGRYKPGERLDIEEIAAKMGTSRTPVREALRRLESEGLVASVPHRGTVVSQLSLDEVAELYHIRAVLELSLIHI